MPESHSWNIRLQRDDVATMIIDALVAVGAGTQDTAKSPFTPQRFLALQHALLVGPPEPRGNSVQYGVWILERFTIHRSNRSSQKDVWTVGTWGPKFYGAFYFPPNPLKFFDEFVRAQNHGLSIEVSWRTDNALYIVDDVAVGPAGSKFR